MTSSYGEIVERLEKLTAPDRETDCIVAAATQWDGVGHVGQRWIEAWPRIRERGPYDITRSANNYRLPAYTASIDAAVALVEKMLPGWSWECRKSGTGDKGQATVWNPSRAPGHNSEQRAYNCASPQAALLIALIRALTVNQNG